MPTPVGGSFATGAYDATWVISSTPRDIGLMEGPIRLQQNVNGIPIRATQWADTIIDYILRGAGCFGVVVLKEWTTYTRTFMWPYGSTMGIVDEAGKKFSDYASQLVLTAQANTPAATLGPVTRTYPYCAVLPGHNLDKPLWAGPRDIVVALGFLPEPASGGSRKAKFFTDT
jgi:hypothetical protein